MTRRNLVLRIVDKLYESRRGRQVMVLGGPRSGKTHMLVDFQHEIERRGRLWMVYGPIPASQAFSLEFYQSVIQWLILEGALDASFALENTPASLLDFWQAITRLIDKEFVRHVVILFDDANAADLGESRLAMCLSTARGFHEEWTDIDFAVHFIWAGNVAPFRLQGLYKGSDSASWPFERDHTLFMLPDITISETESWLFNNNSLTERQQIYAEYLHELTRGNVAGIAALLINWGDQPINCRNLFEACNQLVSNMDWVEALRCRIAGVRDELRQPLGVLLNGQCVRLPKHSELEDELSLAGLIRIREINGLRMARLHDWLVECTLRRHWSEFQPLIGGSAFGDDSELLPPTQTIDRKAFALLNEVENLLRNLSVVRLYNVPTQTHPFVGLNLEMRRRNSYDVPEYDDQYTRSTKWRKSVSNSQFVDVHGALISYTDTKDLLGLLDHLISQNDPVVGPLRWIRPKLDGFKAIRDAVMHGQIITEESLENLMEIRCDLYERLSVKA